jgi:hypothetical protein
MMLDFLGQTALAAFVILALWYAGDWFTGWRKAHSKKKIFFFIVCEFNTPDEPGLRRSSLAGCVQQNEFPTMYSVYIVALEKFAELKETQIDLVSPVFFEVQRDEI